MNLFAFERACARAEVAMERGPSQVIADFRQLASHWFNDVGRALAARALVQLEVEGNEFTEVSRAERVLDRVRAEVGEAALRRWGLPQYLRDMCARHHDDAVPPEHVDLQLLRLTSALALMHEPTLAARAAREIVQSAAALRLGVPGVRALAADLKAAARLLVPLARQRSFPADRSCRF